MGGAVFETPGENFPTPVGVMAIVLPDKWCRIG